MYFILARSLEDIINDGTAPTFGEWIGIGIVVLIVIIWMYFINMIIDALRGK